MLRPEINILINEMRINLSELQTHFAMLPESRGDMLAILLVKNLTFAIQTQIRILEELYEFNSDGNHSDKRQNKTGL